MANAERKDPPKPFGLHRVLDASVVLPQAAEKLDNSLPIYSNEILIEVECLNIDAASFVQMEDETRGDEKAIAEIIRNNIKMRGKQQNRVTGSGGMLVGKVAQIGKKYSGPLKVKVGDRVATLVSLTLTPLLIEEVRKIHKRTHQVEVKGYAILFETSIAAKLPKDLPENIAMAVYDVAGAPATVNALCKSGDTVVILGGGGKAGVLSCVAARRKIGKKGKLIAIEPFSAAGKDLEKLGVCDHVLGIDATNPTLVHAGVSEATRGKMADVVINVASVPNTEMASILSAKARGQVLFFGMATSFSKVTLGAEGIAAGAKLIFGNGYFPKHDEFAIGLLKKHKALRELFFRRYQA